MIIKVCGMREPGNIRAVEAAHPDWMGFILWPGSKRYVPLPPAYLPQPPVKRVGVFVNAQVAEVVQQVRAFGLHLIQLHGQEPPAFCCELRAALAASGLPVLPIIKAFSIATAADLAATRPFLPEPGVCPRDNRLPADYFLFDTKSPLIGGSGQQFDWTVLNSYTGSVPFLLSGGIGPGDLPRLRAFHHPRCIGVDLNSRFEVAPALKDTTVLNPFIHQIHSGMNRINSLFARKPSGLLSLYFCAGHPTLDSTSGIIRTLARRGIDMIEIGIPFSDPMADGPVIQDAATKALRNGMTLRTLFSQLEDIRRDVDIPLILMGYLNPVIQFGLTTLGSSSGISGKLDASHLAHGFEAFCQRCTEVGIDGIILPDLPFRDYQETYKSIADRYDLRIIMLITPETSDDRIRFIDQNTDGFIYMVSSAATTGAQREFDAQKQAYFNHVNGMNLRNPRMIGFGISNHQTLTSAQQNAAGAIIGSKFVTLLDETGDPDLALTRLYEALDLNG